MGHSCKNANIVILVYSINDKKSFQSLNKWLKLIKDMNGEDGYVIGVAANKTDFDKKSVVSDVEGQNYSKQIKAIWKATSAKGDDKGLEELIDELLELYLKMQNNNSNPEYIKLSNNRDNTNNEGGCCNGKVNNNNSKISTINVDENNNKDNDEDF